jgi:quercetin dioxygenase-like cupin family protein
MKTSMCAMALAVVWTLLAQSGAGRAATDPGQRLASGLSRQGPSPLCSASETAADDGATPIPDARFAADRPPGVNASVLAVGDVGPLPDVPAVVVLELGSIDPGVEGVSKRANGPSLLYIVSGSVTVYVEDVEQRLQRGQSLSISTGDSYGFLGDPDEGATLLALAIVPDQFAKRPPGAVRSDRAADVPRKRLRQAAPEPQVLDPESADVLFTAWLESLPPAPASLFLVCVAWDHATTGSPGAYRHPGLVGLCPADALGPVDDSAQGCTVLARDEASTVQPCWLYADGGSGLLFGVLPEHRPLWLPADAEPDATPSDRGQVCPAP